MKKLWVLCVLMLSLVLALAGCGSQKAAPPIAQPEQSAEFTVSAAVSMKDALTEIQNNYQTKHPNIKINFNFGSSGSLQKQIEEGAPVDLFISAADKQMDDLDKKNLIQKDTRKNLVVNQLVLIVPKASSLQLTKFEDLTKDEVKKFAMGAPESVPAGQYTQQVLRNLNIYDAVQQKTVLAKDVRTVLTYVETGNVEAGTVYKTDAAISDKVKVVLTAANGTHDAIIYPMATINTTKQGKAVEEFSAYLMGQDAQDIFVKYGFSKGN